MRSYRYGPICATFLSLLLASLGCGGGVSSASGPRPTPPPVSANAVPAFGHVVLIVEENHSYSQVIGNTGMPYLNNLASQYGVATQYFANVHPSIGDYFMLTTGTLAVTDDTFTGTVNVDNIARQLMIAGKTWKSYAESIPSQGYTGGDVYPYVKRHNPFAYLTDVVNSTTQVQNLVSFSQFGRDLANNQLPNFSFVVPNLLNDAHDGPLDVADAWLQQNIGPLISNPTFQSDGLLIIVFDESGGNDNAHGGGHVPMLVISSQAKQGYRSSTFFQHQSTLRLILQGLGVSAYPGNASNATGMGEFF
jgi:phosphatidylinositol-3-phosphatase